jgi:ATP-dependent Lon protease
VNIATQLSFRDEEFTGTGRLFPLPNLVMFPHVVQALHIFEPRYQQLLEDALVGDSLIVMATSLADAPSECCCRPPISPFACLTRIVSTRSLADGRSDILVLGLRRVRITSELPLVRPYREAELELLRESTQADGPCHAQLLIQELLSLTQQLFSQNPCVDPTLAKILDEQHSLSMITDLLGYSLPLHRDTKLAMLSETDVFKRAGLLLESLAARGHDCGSAAHEPFPPKFSWN